MTDTLIALSETHTHPCLDSKEASALACTGDLPDFHLQGADDMLSGVYQDWFHQNP